jgi:preprotein translocase subunit SecF
MILLAAVVIAFTAPLLYVGVRFTVRHPIGALIALAVTVAWIRALLGLVIE